MNELRWRISCHDPFGRDRALTVLTAGDGVVLVQPPGASAVFSPQQASTLAKVLGEAVADVPTGPPR
ncbi:hypothetical protein EV193_111181 [Herbihabitans rhizosphaerae]|uniref:Uncharacterized protein n=1 Tax=Herbihabitans rhizosphaerae TaxID=1872711 RepID=A0A4Q7KGT2_9PSEU|nr:hypothetical protein [Herbihabitans rhizosphaerae]RZS32796.1 hypothetical protein EV193_111181 [Herbihabitans rhizosphaerae]